MNVSSVSQSANPYQLQAAAQTQTTKKPDHDRDDDDGVSAALAGGSAQPEATESGSLNVQA